MVLCNDQVFDFLLLFCGSCFIFFDKDFSYGFDLVRNQSVSAIADQKCWSASTEIKLLFSPFLQILHSESKN